MRLLGKLHATLPGDSSHYRQRNQSPVSFEVIDQLEFADVLILNKVEKLKPEERILLEALLRKLNPEARLLSTSFADVPLEAILHTGRFDMEKAQASAGWLKELNGHHNPETEEYGITSFVYRKDRPFHPQRLAQALSASWPGVLRSKGFLWLATRHEIMGTWSQAVNSLVLDPVGPWWAVQKDSLEQEWPEDREDAEYIKARWSEPFGDRRQELVFIGITLDEKDLRRRLDECLLIDEEMNYGPETWSEFPDPLPAWSFEGEHHHEHPWATLEVHHRLEARDNSHQNL